MDVESIAPGTDFAEVIDAAVGSCTALVTFEAPAVVHHGAKPCR